eukprot:513497_1
MSGRGKGGKGLGNGGAKRFKFRKEGKGNISGITSLSSVKRMNRSTGHLRSWIKVNQIKDEFSNDMLSKCMESILKLYGSQKDLLNFLIQHSSKQSLDEMYNILQKKLE